MADKEKKTLTILQHGTPDAKKTPIKAKDGDFEGTYYVWNTTLAKPDEGPLYAVGQTAEYIVEDKPYNNQSQLFLWRPKGGGGGGRGGGQAKADPLKMEGMKQGNHLNNSAIAMQLAVTILGPGQDLNDYRKVAFDLCNAMVQNCAAFKGLK